MAGAGVRDGQHATNLPKQVSAAELRACLHLPAKDVAKKLGICLTSLKKKIQCLENSMADGSHDGAALKEELAKLLHERNSLPHNFGGCGKTGGWDDEDGTPASPLSCASTSTARSDDAVDLDGDPGRNVQAMEVMAAGHEQLEQDAQQGDRSLAVREQHAYAEASSLHDEAAPALDHHAQSAAATRTAGGVKPGTAKREERTGEVDAGDVWVEWESPNAASQVGNGAHWKLDRDRGATATQIQVLASSDQSQACNLIPTRISSMAAMRATGAPAVETTGCAPEAARHLRSRRAGQRQAAGVMTDAEMIAALAGCASLPPTPATTLAQPAVAWQGDVSDWDLVAALAADAFASWQGGRDQEVVSDLELAAALAGCAAETGTQSADTQMQLADTQMQDACLAPPSPDMEHWSQGAAELEHHDNPEIEHEDRVLEMALFHGTH